MCRPFSPLPPRRETIMRSSRPAFSLLELLVVMALLGVFVALMLTAVVRARQSANRTSSPNNLRQLAMAVHSYHDANNALPPYASMTPKYPVFGSWWIYLLPYVEQQSLYDKIAGSHAIASGGGTILIPPVQQDGIRDARFGLLTCPSDPSHPGTDEGTTNYLANWYVLGDGVKGCYGPPRDFRDILDGFSNTVLFAEGYAECNGTVRPALTDCGTHNFGITPKYLPSDDPSYLPKDYTMFQVRPSLQGPGRCSSLRTQTGHDHMPVALADGSARFLQPDI